ncbi:hypothetical protein Nepgr_030816 [Nepenthes gracilis]|uniref:Uncharacterized protein n=1 Tax=Nepenthes gracilis TaxID=150966 RepID=A0AAD3TH98_NEPGR|nr:hypothetical protein Nepgr_030816 [Nepenthes gracilis]
MGFDLKNRISRFASKQGRSTETRCFRIGGDPSSLKPATGKSNEKIIKYPTKRLEQGDIKVTKSVKFDCSHNRCVKVSPNETLTRPATAISNVSSTSSNIKTHPSNPNSASCSSGKVHSKSTNPDSTSVSTKRHLNPNSTSSYLGGGCTKSTSRSKENINYESSGNNQARLPSPKGLHSRNLSYGTIYNAPNSNALKENPPQLKDGQIVKVDRDDANIREPKPSSRPVRRVFGFGGCNYGHGSIVNGTKSLKNFASDSKISCSKNDAENKSSCSTKLKVGMVDELKNAGNEEYRRGRFMNAISFYDKAIASCPHNAACHNNKAAALAALGKLRDAIEQCHKATRSDPTYRHAHHRLGTLYTRLGQIDDAKKHFKLSGHDHSSESVRHLLLIEKHIKKLNEALKVESWDRVLEEGSRILEAGADACDLAIAAKAEALLKLHRANEALESLVAAKKIIEERSREARSHLLIVETQAYFYLGRFEEAVHAAEQAANLEVNIECLTWLKKAWGAAEVNRAGNEYYKVGKYSEACAMYSQGLQYLPANGVLLCNRAACKARLRQWEGTIKDCNAALKSNPEYSKALRQRAYAHTKLGQWEDAHRDNLALNKLYHGDPAFRDSHFHVQMELQKTKWHHYI